MRVRSIIYMLLVLMVFSSCKSNTSEVDTSVNAEVKHGNGEWSLDNSPLNNLPIDDNNYLYEVDDDVSIEYVYATILPTTNKQGEHLTLDKLNQVKEFNVKAPILDIHFQTGDEEGPDGGLIYEAVQKNATITIRGHSTRRATQKSYKIKLSDKVPLWDGQKTLNLNKHAFDPTRITNKIAFDLFEGIPDITSMQLQFVKLYVRDLSNGSSGEFVDYGYYTHIEQPNKSFLNSHGLDKSGSLYKAEYFEFIYDPLSLKYDHEPGFDKALFEGVLETKAGKSNTQIVDMIKDINDFSLSINDVMDQHFNRDNYLTWMAANILLGNYDTNSQNFFLYSPQNSQTWYFLPWDYDGSLGNDLLAEKIYEGKYVGKRPRWIALYWNTMLASRFFKFPENVEALNKKIEEVSQYTNVEIMSTLVDKYDDYAYEAITTIPDIKHIYEPIDVIKDRIKAIPTLPTENKEAYYEALDSPMPVYMNDVAYDEDSIHFSWDKSFDLQGDHIGYQIEVSKDLSFSQPLIFEQGIKATYISYSLTDHNLKGHYFWRLTIFDEHGHYQYPFDYYEDEEGVMYQGVSEFSVVE